MAEPTYQDIINKMATLQDLASTVENASKNLTSNKQELLKLIGDANKQIQNLQGNIDKIKSQGTQAKTQVAELIKNANERQQATLEKLKLTINSMTDTTSLKSQLGLLKTDIDKLASGLNVPDDSTTDPSAANQSGRYVPPPMRPPPTSGGYTYGKSMRKGKGRRRRNKSSRKKGSIKK